MEVLSTFLENHFWLNIGVIVFCFVVYEIIVRKLPTDSPYWSIVHSLGVLVKPLGKIAIKALGENLSKEVEKDENGNNVVDELTKKPRRKIFK